MNINTDIVDPQGRELWGAGGQQALKTETYKGYTISLEWFVGSRSTEPMLCIWPTIGGRDSGVWGICLSSAGKFSTPDNQPTPECFIEATEVISDIFDRIPLKVEVHNLVDVVMKYIDDLVMMPPTPRAVQLDALGRPVVEVTRKENGKVVQEVSL